MRKSTYHRCMLVLLLSVHLIWIGCLVALVTGCAARPLIERTPTALTQPLPLPPRPNAQAVEMDTGRFACYRAPDVPALMAHLQTCRGNTEIATQLYIAGRALDAEAQQLTQMVNDQARQEVKPVDWIERLGWVGLLMLMVL